PPSLKVNPELMRRCSSMRYCRGRIFKISYLRILQKTRWGDEPDIFQFRLAGEKVTLPRPWSKTEESLFMICRHTLCICVLLIHDVSFAGYNVNALDA
ncbi:hypothetical protein A2U01_0022384, partial [Trifolium medium]|nr:hypothetical protein [Trifolium medium]